MRNSDYKILHQERLFNSLCCSYKSFSCAYCYFNDLQWNLEDTILSYTLIVPMLFGVF